MKISNNTFYFLLILAVAVNLTGVGTGFFTDDPGLYASIAKQMVYRHDYINLYSYGHDWLDKPHFPFWMAALSFKILGIYDWSYRLPALLFFLMGVGYTYLFANKFYGRDAALIAVLIVLVAQHGIMSNTDVRAEPYLFGCLIAVLYHLSNLKNKPTFVDFFAVAFFTACAVMTKGIFIMIGIYGSLLAELFFTGELKQLRQAKYWLLILVTGIFITPEICALYVQFDLHPEKVIFGRTHVSGIRFFFWDSQFGRFFNTGPINRESGSKFFFLHTLLWAYAPWCFLLYLATYKRLKIIFKKRALKEYYTITGSTIMLLLFSFSGFQLPFYTNILFPLFSILIAGTLVENLSDGENRFIIITQLIYIIAFPLLLILINLQMSATMPEKIGLTVAIGISLIGGLTYVFKIRQQKIVPLLFFSVIIMVLVNGYVGIKLYPALAANKAELQAADFINKKTGKSNAVFVLQNKFNSFQFYVNRPVELISASSFGKLQVGLPAYVFVHHEDIDVLNLQHIKYTLVKTFNDYDHEGILPKFFSPITRHETLSKVYLISQ